MKLEIRAARADEMEEFWRVVGTADIAAFNALNAPNALSALVQALERIRQKF